MIFLWNLLIEFCHNKLDAETMKHREVLTGTIYPLINAQDAL